MSCTLVWLCEGRRVKPLSALHSSSPPLSVDLLGHLDDRPLVEREILCSLTRKVKQSQVPLLHAHVHTLMMFAQQSDLINVR